MTTTASETTERGSDAAFGARMRARIDEMLRNPCSFLPSYEVRYKKLLEHAKSLTPHQAYAMTLLLGKDSARGYPDMPCTAELEFPRVNAIDLTAQFGWYYFAGTCQGEDGVEYGVLCMLFQYSLLPPSLARELGLSDVENQIIDLQLSIAVDGGRFHQIDPVVTAGTSGRVEVSRELHLVADSCSVEALEPGRPFPLRVRARGADLGGAAPVDLAIDLTFSSSSAYLPQGCDGAEPLVAGLGTRYYSIPGLVVDSSRSRISLGGKSIALRGGKFWFDHQWGLGLVPTGSPRYASLRALANLASPAPPGWDFFVANLDGGSAVTLNALHTTAQESFFNQTGATPPPTMTTVAVGKYMDPYGTVFNVSGQLQITDWRRTNHSPDPAKYRDVGTWVPHGWAFQLVEKVVPERFRRFEMVPLSDDAQALFFANGVQYVEAATRIRDASGALAGTGFAEATGYVDGLPAILRLAGIQPDAATVKFFKEEPSPSPSLLMQVLSLIDVLQPSQHAEINQLIACASTPVAARPVDCEAAAAPLSADASSSSATPVPSNPLEMARLFATLKATFHAPGSLGGVLDKLHTGAPRGRF